MLKIYQDYWPVEISDWMIASSPFSHYNEPIHCQEYENQETLESHIVRDFDRFDMILQAHEYEKSEPERRAFLQEFFDSTEG